MKLTMKRLASSLTLASAMCVTSAFAAEPPELPSYVLGGGSTSAIFKGGATINNGANFISAVPFGQTADVIAKIVIPLNNIGDDGDLYLVVRDSNNLFYQYNGTALVPWNGFVSTLSPFVTKTLAAEEVISLTDIETLMGGDMAGELVRVFVGYATDNTLLAYNRNAIPFSFGPAPSSTCPSGTTALEGEVDGKGLCQLSGTYTDDLHLTSNFNYVISGAVFIGGDNENSASLTIDAGTTTYGESGNDFLVINRGSMIHVNGTAANPVIMTSANDAEATASTRGQWGGLIINGNAPINGCAENVDPCEAQGEGSTGLYGGNNPEDNSGNLNYLIVKYAGFEITPDNELNGIAFQAVGNGTLVDYIQVHNNSDDGVEFFGGTVTAKHLVLTGNADDSVDWTLGWQGKLQHVVVYQTDRGDQGIEADNNDDNRDSTPRSQPKIANITLVGNSNTDLGALLREGTGANITNAVITGFADACIDIDHGATFVNGGTSATDLSGDLTMTYTAVDCDVNFDEEIDDNWSVDEWFNGQNGNVETSLGMTSFINSSAANSITAGPQLDAFFDETDYIGAVKDQANDWTAGWIYQDL